VDQQHKSIDPEKTVFEVISGGLDLMTLGNRQVNARAYVARFNFSGADQEKKCGMLSGGERNRLHLALALKEEGNVLLLDEPTNDIDVNTLRALEEGLENFAGCAVVISHDRWFLDRIATHILSVRGRLESGLLRRFLLGVRGVEEGPGRRHAAPPGEVQKTDRGLVFCIN